jgi:hypothetical protein
MVNDLPSMKREQVHKTQSLNNPKDQEISFCCFNRCVEAKSTRKCTDLKCIDKLILHVHTPKYESQLYSAVWNGESQL